MGCLWTWLGEIAPSAIGSAIGGGFTVYAAWWAFRRQRDFSAEQARRNRTIDLYLKFITQEMLQTRSAATVAFKSYHGHLVAKGHIEPHDMVELGDVFKHAGDSRFALAELLNFYSGLLGLLEEEDLDNKLAVKLFGPIVEEHYQLMGGKLRAAHHGAQRSIDGFERLYGTLLAKGND